MRQVKPSAKANALIKDLQATLNRHTPMLASEFLAALADTVGQAAANVVMHDALDVETAFDIVQANLDNGFKTLCDAAGEFRDAPVAGHG